MLRDRLFYGAVFTALVHGGWLIKRTYSKNN